MKKDNTKAVATVADPKILLALREEYPVEQGFTQTLLPRLGMFSQDVKEGKGKAMKVVTEAGTFYIDRESDEVDEETKKKIWEKEELGDSVEGIIIFQRKQLRHYNESTEEYTSSPIYDTNEDVVPLFLNKKEVARGTPSELRALPQFQIVKDGKTKSALEENRILYVLMGEEVFQMNLRGSSMYSYKGYAKELAQESKSPNTVFTSFTSEACEKGDIEWNKMIFSAERDINGDEAQIVVDKIKEIKEGVEAQKEFFANQESSKEAASAASKKKLDEF